VLAWTLVGLGLAASVALGIIVVGAELGYWPW
jgi:hypothetical protein